MRVCHNVIIPSDGALDWTGRKLLRITLMPSRFSKWPKPKAMPQIARYGTLS